MDDKIIAIFVIVSDLLRAMGHQDDPQRRMTDAEVITTALVAMLFHHGNFELARSLLNAPHYMPGMLSRSRFNRRLHEAKPWLLTLFALLGEHWKEVNLETVYVIDTFPVPVCDNYRIRRCRLYQDEAFRGYIASKKRYFYGLKIHLLVTTRGEPVEFFLTPGADSDVACLDLFDFDLPEDSEILADKIYNDYLLEDLLQEAGYHFMPLRKKTSTRKNPPWLVYWQSVNRRLIETSASVMEQMFPKSIHAVTSCGFELKIVLFILAHSFNCLFKVAT